MTRLVLVSAVLLVATMTAQAPGSLTAEEKAAGWKLVFDGASLAGWRAYKSQTPPAGWRASNGELIRDAAGGDLMTVEQFGDFELRLDWKIAKNGNSGIMFRATTEGEFPYSTGPEFQILDNAGHKDGQSPLTSAGSNYAVNPPVKDVTKPVGEWNSVRLIARGPHVEHWMNGVKLLEYDFGSPDWEARVKASKFATMPGYGRAPRGYIVLQDHGDLVTYRNIKIRPL
ncbi:MAG: 3-keto-disaccharide hydrolase [Bryobacteraceae bacterium]